MPSGYLPPVVAEFRANVTQAVEQINTFRNALAGVDKAFVKAAEASLQFDRRMESSGTAAQALKTETERLDQQLNLVARQGFTTASTAAVDAAKAIKDTGVAVGELGGKLSPVGVQVTEFGDKFAGVDAKVKAFAREVQSTNTPLARLEKLLADGAASADVFARNVGTGTKANADFAAALPALNTEMATLRTRFTEVNSRANVFATRINAAEAAKSRFERNVITLNAEMAKLMSTLGLTGSALAVFANTANQATGHTTGLANSTRTWQMGMLESYRTLLLVGGALGVTDAATIKFAGTFQDEMTRLQTEAGLSDAAINKFAGSMKGLEDKVIAVGNATGFTGPQIAHALYDAVSAGLELGKALDVVKYGAQEARISGAKLDETVSAGTAVMKNYGEAIKSPEQAFASLNAIVGTGKMRFQDFNESIKNWVPSAAAFGVSLDSAGAALAYMTDRGESAQTAGTKLAQVMAMLAGQTTQAGKLMKGLGLSTDEVTASSEAMQGAMSKAHITTSRLATDLKKPDGLYVAIHDLETGLRKAGLSTEAAESVLVRAFGGGRQFKGMAELIHDTDGLRQKFEQIAHDENIAHFEEQWLRVTHTFKFQFSEMVVSVQNFALNIGRILLPAGEAMVRMLAGTFRAMGENKALVDALATAFGVLAVALPLLAVGMFLTKLSETAVAVASLTLKLAVLIAGFQYGVSHITEFWGVMSLLGSSLLAINVAMEVWNSGAIQGLIKGIDLAQLAFRVFMLEIAAAPAGFATLRVAMAGIFTFLTGPWGIAIGVAAVAIGVFVSHMMSAKSTTDDTKVAIEGLTEAIKQDDGAIGSNTVRLVAHKLEQDGLLKSAEKLHVGVGLMTTAMLGQGESLDLVRTKLEGIIEANKIFTHTEGAPGETIVAWTGSLTDQGNAAKALLDEVNKLNGGAQGSIDAFNREKDATKAATDAMNDAAGANGKLEYTAKGVTSALSDLKAEAKKLTDIIDMLNGRNIDATKAEMAFRDAADHVTASIEKNGDTIKINTTAGRANIKAVLDGADAAKAHMAAVRSQTGSVEQAIGVFQADIGVLQDNMRAAHLNEDAIKFLTDTYLQVPKNLPTDISLHGDEDVIARVHAVARAMLVPRDRDVYVTVHERRDLGVIEGSAGGRATGGLVERFAAGGVPQFPSGGYVSGPGTSWSDSIPAMLSDHEYVVRADAVRHATLPVLDALNAGRLSDAHDMLGRVPEVARAGARDAFAGIMSSALSMPTAGGGLPLGGSGRCVIEVHLRSESNLKLDVRTIATEIQQHILRDERLNVNNGLSRYSAR